MVYVHCTTNIIFIYFLHMEMCIQKLTVLHLTMITKYSTVKFRVPQKIIHKKQDIKKFQAGNKL